MAENNNYEPTEIEIIKSILDLEKAKNKSLLNRGSVEREQFKKDEPTQPDLLMCVRKYPPIVSQAKVNWFAADKIALLGAVLCCLNTILRIVGVIVFLIGFKYSADYRKKVREEDEEKIRQSEEYKSKCAELDKQYDERDAEYKADYDAGMLEYNKQLEAYKAEKETWEKDKQARLDAAKVALEKVTDELASAYAKYDDVLAPVYRNIDALEFIYDYLESRRCSLEDAKQAYEKELENRKREEQLRREEEYAIRQEEAARRAEEAAYSNNNNYESGSSSGGFARDVAASAIGTAIGNRSIKKEMQRQARKASEKEQYDRIQNEVKANNERLERKQEQERILRELRGRRR